MQDALQRHFGHHKVSEWYEIKTFEYVFFLRLAEAVLSRRRWCSLISLSHAAIFGWLFSRSQCEISPAHNSDFL
jgi:hypothetical protein